MKQTYIFSILLIISGCKSKLEDESAFPAVTSVSTLKTTEFVPTLESSFSTDNNIVYCATFPYAWAEIKKEIGTPLSQFTNKWESQWEYRLLKVPTRMNMKLCRNYGNEITAKAMLESHSLWKSTDQISKPRVWHFASRVFWIFGEMRVCQNKLFQ